MDKIIKAIAILAIVAAGAGVITAMHRISEIESNIDMINEQICYIEGEME